MTAELFSALTCTSYSIGDHLLLLRDPQIQNVDETQPRCPKWSPPGTRVSMKLKPECCRVFIGLGMGDSTASVGIAGGWGGIQVQPPSLRVQTHF